MAIDGVKIIDSDTAFDVYSEFMDLYDNNVDVNDIKNKMESWKNYELDDNDYEIFITVYALSLWEIGELNDEILDEVKTVIAKQSVAKLFLSELGDKEYKARIKETDKLIQKISSINQKIRKRKKYKKIENFLFTKGDMFYFTSSDDTNYFGLIYDISQYRGKCFYYFVYSDYKGDATKFNKVIKKTNIYARKIPSGIKTVYGNYVIGLDSRAIEHKDLYKFRDTFLVIGNVKFREQYSEVGSIGFLETIEELKGEFIKSEQRLIKLNSIKIPLRDIIE